MNQAGDTTGLAVANAFPDEGGSDVAVAARRSAMDLLARREHSRFELQRKLLRRYAREVVLPTVDRLAEEGLQSDARFAESYVRQRGERGYGPLRIQRELQERGVEDGAAETALQASGFDWSELARHALEKKFGTLASRVSLPEKARM